MSEDRTEKLLHMHNFYSEEARHQRSMMWETVKWFTIILTGLSAFWVSYYVKEEPSASLLILSSLLGVILSFTCIFLLRSFYRTNIKYITMFAKIEEALDFDKRKKTERSMYWPGDDYFTWWGYIEYRTQKPSQTKKDNRNQREKHYTSEAFFSNKSEEYNTSGEYFNKITSDCLPTKIENIFIKIRNYIFSWFGCTTKEVFSIYDLMKWVFYLFSVSFFIALILSVLHLTCSK